MQEIIKIENGVTRMPAWRMAEPVNYSLRGDEQQAIVGPNGGGKSMLIDILVGRHPLLMRDVQYDFSPSTSPLVSDNIKYITFRDAYGGDNDKSYYLQQRWNQMEINEETPTVGSKLDEAFLRSGEDSPRHRELRDRLYKMFNIDKLLDKYIILLSSGELRKLKLTEALLSAPRVLIMDNPFIGLDAEARDQLKELLKMLVGQQNLQIILVLSKSDDIPDFITHVVEVRSMKVMPKVTLEEYQAHRQPIPPHVLSESKAQAILDLPERLKDYHAHDVVKMHNVRIQYGKRVILKDLDWTVHNGEHWALSGQNGACMLSPTKASMTHAASGCRSSASKVWKSGLS